MVCGLGRWLSSQRREVEGEVEKMERDIERMKFGDEWFDEEEEEKRKRRRDIGILI